MTQDAHPAWLSMSSEETPYVLAALREYAARQTPDGADVAKHLAQIIHKIFAQAPVASASTSQISSAVAPQELELRWTVCADGACASTNPGPCGWGAVVINHEAGHQGDDHFGFIGHGTNQVAELMAAIEGLARTPVGARVELISDSKYVLCGLTEWRAGWESRGFMNAKREPVANQPLWLRLYAVADARQVTTRWVKGHSGHILNERADALANRSLAAARKA